MGCALAEIIGNEKLLTFSGFQEYGVAFKSTSCRISTKLLKYNLIPKTYQPGLWACIAERYFTFFFLFVKCCYSLYIF